MKTKPINWNKIIANAGLAFFTSMTANIVIGNIDALATSAIVSALYAGLAFFTEMKIETEGGLIGKTQRVIATGLII